MNEHTTKDEPGTQPTRDEVARKAYALYQKEGHPQGHAEQNWLTAEAQLQHAGSDVAVETADVILVRSNPLDVVAIIELSRATYRKMIQNLVWATGYNVIAIPLAAGALYAWGVLLSPALGAALMAASTVIVAINARLLRLKK